MDELVVIKLVQEAMYVTLKFSAPMLAVSLVVGLIISIFQTTTSIQEQTLTFVPKLIAIFAVIIWTAGWLTNGMKAYTMHIFNLMSQLVK